MSAATSPGVHVHRFVVPFGHCDPAGIVYFPRFFDYFHLAMETWFGAHLSMSYAEVVSGRKIGLPAVHTEADFSKPSAFGDDLEIALRVGRIGRSSIELRYEVRGHGETQARVTGRTVVTTFDMDPSSAKYRRSLPIPDDLRAAIEAFGVG